MRSLTTGAVLLIIGAAVFAFFSLRQLKVLPNPDSQSDSSPSVVSENSETVKVIAEGLDTPWALGFISDSEILVTERAGRVRLIKDGKLQEAPVATIPAVKEIGEGGLMGLALHPDFKNNNFVYLYYTFGQSNGQTLNRVVRMNYLGGTLKDEKIIVDKIPGAPNHNGGRIKFGPDGYLYITTGDAQEPSLAQNRDSLAGKILRVVSDSQVSVYSYGHRNPQGLAWDNNGQLYSTEHGPSGGQYGTGRDEFNKIGIGKNYGWPEIMGDQTKAGMEVPLSHSGDETWAPAGAAYYQYSKNNFSIFFGGLRGQALYEMNFQDGNTLLRTHFKGEFGRIREVILGSDQMLYLTTSNLDGRGNPKSGDDKIIRIDPERL